MDSRKFGLFTFSICTVLISKLIHAEHSGEQSNILFNNTESAKQNYFHLKNDESSVPVPLEGLTFSLKRDLNPCHSSNSESNCGITTTRVFTSRYRFRRYVLSRKFDLAPKIKLRRKRRKQNFENEKSDEFHNETIFSSSSEETSSSPLERQKRNSRTILAVSTVGLWPKWCRLVAFFRVFRQDFTLCLYKKFFASDPILTNWSKDLGVTLYDEHANGTERKSFHKLEKQGLSYVTGHVLGKPFSSVQGYVRKNRFYGTIYVKGMILFVEPIISKNKIRFTMMRNQRKKRSLNAYIYKVYQRQMEQVKIKDEEHGGFSNRDKYVVENSDNRCRSCSLMIMADFEFFADVGESSIQKTVHAMLYHVREANLLLRRQDFNNDQVSDCIGIHVSDIRIVASPNVRFRDKDELYKSKLTNYWKWNLKGKHSKEEDYQVKSPEDFLKMFSMSHLDGHCLGVLFSNKAFSSRVLGLAWKGDPKKQSGICQKRRQEVMLKHSKESADLNLNALFVTLRTKSMQRIPLRMGVLNLLHEILHAFGAGHDHEGVKDSSVESDDRFLMSRYSNTGIHANHSRLSDKSRLSIQQLLSNEKMSNCLETLKKDSLCGDGLVQDGEECDCGSVESCLSQKSCCVQPGGGPRRQEGCTLSVPRQIFGKCRHTAKRLPKKRLP